MGTIEIDIDRSQNSGLFDGNESLFKDECIVAKSKIEKAIILSESGDHKPITVFGRRGAGKTSFLKTLHKIFEDSKNKDTKEQKICVLDLLEPNRIEKNEIFLVTVIAAIMKRIQRTKKYQEHSENDRFETETYKENRLNEVDCKLNELAKSFNVLVPFIGITSRSVNESSNSFAERMLEDSYSGLTIEQGFEAFVEAASKYLGCKAFLLLIDDTDVAYQMCENVCETIRKYLGIKGLVIVLAAEEELFDIHLTKYSWSWMNDQIKIEKEINEASGKSSMNMMERYRSQAHALKEQYLSKIFPPYNRVYLSPLSYKIRDKRVFIELKRENEANKTLEECLFDLGVLLGNGFEIATRQLLPSSNRSLIRMFRILFEYKQNPDKKEKDILKKELLENLDHLFRPALHDVGVHIWLLRYLRDGIGDLELMRWVLKRTIDIPRSFDLTRDPNERSDDRHVVPALLHVSWAFGCIENERTDAFLSYGIRVVLPACIIERSKDRKTAEEELEYRLKPAEDQGCIFTMGRLLTWRNDKGMDKFALGDFNIETNENSRIDWYFRKADDYNNFFIGLARIADACCLKNIEIKNVNERKVTADKLQKSKDENEKTELERKLKEKENEHVAILKKINNYLTALENKDKLKPWLKLNAGIYKLKDEKFKVLPTRLIGEIFVFLFNQRGPKKPNDVNPSDNIQQRYEPPSLTNYILAFWYALLMWEINWREQEQCSIKVPFLTPRASYMDVQIDEITQLFDYAIHRKEGKNTGERPIFLPHSIVWLLCPLFDPAEIRTKLSDYLQSFENSEEQEFIKAAKKLLK